jgi:HK97 family phage major capsid protein
MPTIAEIIARANEEKQTRSFFIERSAIDEENRTVALSFSSEEPVERWFGYEILDHNPKSVNLGRLKKGGSLLVDHDMTKLVGVIEEVSIDGAAKKGRAKVRCGKHGLADDIFSDMLDGIRMNVSVGYMVDEMVLEKEVKDGPSTYRVTRWTPFEISSVAVPADITVGVGRQQGDLKPAETKIAAPKEERKMSEDKKLICEACGIDMVDGKCPNSRHDEVVNALQRMKGMSGEEMEKTRKTAITNLCNIYKMPDNYREMWIGQGLSTEQTIEEIRKVSDERIKNSKPESLIGLTPAETNRFSLIRAIQAVSDNNWKNAPFELEVSRAVAAKMNRFSEPTKFFVPYEVMGRPNISRIGANGGSYRDATAGTTSAGGYLVETSNQGFIEQLYNRSVCFRMGARRLSGLTGNVAIPRQSGGSTAYWLTNEATQATETSLTFAQVSLTPKNVAAYVEISRQLMLQSSPGAEGIVSDDLAKQVAVAADLAGLEGSGSPQPTGIASTSGIGSFTGATLAYAAVLNAQEDLATSNIVPMRGGYVATPAVASICMQRVKFTSTASPLWEGNLWDGTMCGFPSMSSNQLSAATMIFGDWQELIMAEWGVLEVEVNPYANFQAGIIGVRAMYTMDVGVRRAAAFTRATSIT